MPYRALSGDLIKTTERRQQLARFVTDALAPAQTAAVLLTLVAWRSAPNTSLGVASAAIAAVFAGVIPFWYLRRGVRRGHWTNRHVPVREQRRRPLMAALVSVLAGLGVLLLLGAARELLALIVAMSVGLLVTLAISQFWKLSIHSAVMAGTAVVLMFVFGVGAFVAWLIVGLVAWSRRELGDHTTAQVVAGCIVGAIIAGVVFPTLR